MAKRKEHVPESKDDKRSRERLALLLETGQRTLEQLFEVLRERLAVSRRETVERLNVLREVALERQKGILQHLRTGVNRTQRRLLTEVGMFGEELRAKMELFWECLQEGILQPILKTLNSLLGSLSKVFAALHAVKEFKEMMEVAVDRLGPKADPIVVQLNPLPKID